RRSVGRGRRLAVGRNAAKRRRLARPAGRSAGRQHRSARRATRGRDRSRGQKRGALHRFANRPRIDPRRARLHFRQTALSATPASPGAYRTIGFLLALLGVLSFSIRPVLVKVAYTYARDPVTLLALRMVFSLPFFAFAAWWLQRNKPAAPIETRDKWAIVGLGVIGYYLASFFDYLSLQYITAGLSRLIHFTYPTIVVLLGMLFLRKAPRVAEVLALMLTYVGLAVMLLSTAAGQDEFLTLGAAMSFGSAVSYAVYLFAGTQVIQRVGSMRFAAYALMVSSFCCILQFVLLRPL